MCRRKTWLGILLGLFCVLMAGCTPVIPEEIIRQEISSPGTETEAQAQAASAVQGIVDACTGDLPYEHYAAWRTADWICAADESRRTAARTFFEAFDPEGYAAVIAYGDPDYLNEALNGYTAAMERFFSETKGAFCLQDFYDLNRSALEQEAAAAQAAQAEPGDGE